MKNRFLETADVARLLGITPETVRMHARSGRLPVVAVTRRGRLFDHVVVEAFRLRRRARLVKGEVAEMHDSSARDLNETDR